MVEFNYDYDYSDLMDGVIDDSVDTSYAPPTTDYSVLGDAASGVGSGIADLFGQYANFIGPSYLGAAGFNPTTGFPNLEDMVNEGNLLASSDISLQELLELAGTLPTDEFDVLLKQYSKNQKARFAQEDRERALSSGYGSGYDDMLSDYNFDIDDYTDDFFDMDVFAGIDNTPGEGSGYDPRLPEDPYPNIQEIEVQGRKRPETEKAGFMSSLLSALGLGGIMQGGIGGAFGNILGSMIGGKGSGSPLIDYLMMKSLLKDEPNAGGSVPIGGQAYGGPAFNYQDYQPTNLQPALMPGVGYANMAAPAMMGGGETKQYPNKGLAALAKQAPEVVERMGYEHGGSIENRPGDITFAKLEPGEFVIQKPAVDIIGIETLRKINSMGDGRSYNG